eukprot:2741631-Prymnesium_polylepis.1
MVGSHQPTAVRALGRAAGGRHTVTSRCHSTSTRRRRVGSNYLVFLKARHLAFTAEQQFKSIEAPTQRSSTKPAPARPAGPS